MSYQPSFVSGDWKATCQVCARVFKGSQIRRRWDGMYVCQEDWEPKHPQLSVRGVKDDQRAPFNVPDALAGVAPETWEGSTNKADVVSYSRDLLVGVSSDRPSPDIGIRYFDTNLGNILFGDGSNWVYSNGTTWISSLIIDDIFNDTSLPLKLNLPDDASRSVPYLKESSALSPPLVILSSGVVARDTTGSTGHGIVKTVNYLLDPTQTVSVYFTVLRPYQIEEGVSLAFRMGTNKTGNAPTNGRYLATLLPGNGIMRIKWASPTSDDIIATFTGAFPTLNIGSHIFKASIIGNMMYFFLDGVKFYEFLDPNDPVPPTLSAVGFGIYLPQASASDPYLYVNRFTAENVGYRV